MNVTFPCPKCEQAGRVELALDAHEYTCPNCSQSIAVPDDLLEGGKLVRCVSCPSRDLFTRKDFPQSLGVTIVAIGALISTIFWAYGYPLWSFATLFVMAGIDVLLYVIVPNCVMCYRCGAIYRGAPGMDEHEPFDLETHEKHRQQKIRLAESRSTVPEQPATPQE
jgi:DNA-directed RNA polymerase subunit RPC12/RpoP